MNFLQSQPCSRRGSVLRLSARLEYSSTARAPRRSMAKASSPGGNGQSKTSTGQSVLLINHAVSHSCGSMGTSDWLINNSGAPVSWRLLWYRRAPNLLRSHEQKNVRSICAPNCPCQRCSRSFSRGCSRCSYSVLGGYSAMTRLKVSSTLRSASLVMACSKARRSGCQSFSPRCSTCSVGASSSCLTWLTATPRASQVRILCTRSTWAWV